MRERRRPTDGVLIAVLGMVILAVLMATVAAICLFQWLGFV